ncbi:MAG: hypothetical protein KDI48_01040 [Xanthomonadales bacterium]|nr:hypothetical protein [Xanthomonadales bacterium]
MHPILLQSRLRGRLALHRWWQGQPDNAVLLLAGMAMLAVLLWAVAGVAAATLQLLSATWQNHPMLFGMTLAVLSAMAGGTVCGRYAQRWRRGIWSVQPRSARQLPSLLAQMALLSAGLAGLSALTIGLLLAGELNLAVLTLTGSCMATTTAAALLTTRLGRRRVAMTRRQGRVRAASPTWPGGAFDELLQRWLADRIGAQWRHGSLSLGGFLAIGLLLPADVKGAPLLLGLLLAGLLLRWLVVLQAGGRLLLEATPALAAQPLTAQRWRQSHARCVLAASAWLGAVAMLGLWLLGTAWWLAPAIPALLLALAWLDVLILAVHRQQPRRRTLVWRLLLVLFVIAARDALPLLPLLWLSAVVWHGRRVLQMESPDAEH